MSITKVILAAAFADWAHGSIDQRRKYTGEPYISHPVEVARLVGEHCPQVSSEQLAAAYLHDVVEDTPVTLDEIDQRFGTEVAELVEMLTDVSKPEDGNRAARKAIDREHTSQASPEAQSIKLADLISNTKSIVEHDPEFARVYLLEKKALLQVLKQGERSLWFLANKILNEGFAKLNMEQEIS